MRDYPYSLEEFTNAVKKQYLHDYCKNNKAYMEEMIKSENLDEIIKNNYNSNKFEYETEERDLLDDLEHEVRSTVACLGMF